MCSQVVIFFLLILPKQALSQQECGPLGVDPAQSLPTSGLYSTPVDSSTPGSNVLQTHTALSSGAYKLIMQRDCNLVVCKDGTQIVWQSWTAGQGRNCNLQLTEDGNLEIVEPVTEFVERKLWETGAAPGSIFGPFWLLLSVTGDIDVYATLLEAPVWSTVTYGLA